MIRDLSSVLADAVRRGTSYPRGARAVLDDLGRAVKGSRVQWDEDAGEEWGRVLIGVEVVALVRMLVPLLFVRSSLATYVQEVAQRNSLETIAVDDLHDPVFRASRDALAEFVGSPSRVSENINPDRFSALDLWWTSN